MVKIRLRRIGTKGRPFYRIVVAKSSAGRNGAFVENLGTYDPLVKPAAIKVDEVRALHWLMTGAQPTETTAYLLNKVGVLPKYFEARPAAKKSYAFLDKRTAAISVKSAIEAPVEAPAKKKAEAAVEPTVAADPVAEVPAEVLADNIEETLAEVEGKVEAPAALPQETPEAAADETPAVAETENS